MPTNQHINVNALIKCWLFFMGCFAIARYPLAICILLGLMGGLAGGLLSQWWQLTQNPQPVKQDEASRLPRAVELFRKKIQSFGSQRQAQQTQRQRQQPRVGLFGRTQPPRPTRSRRKRRSDRQTNPAPDATSDS